MALSLILLFPVLIMGLPERCSHPSGTMQGEIELESQSGGDKITRTVINSNMALQETLCYKIEYETTDHTGIKRTRKLLYTLEYDSLKHVYNYKNSYEFKIPQTKISCWCDCPGGSNQCDSDTDSCGLYNHDEDSCVNWYEDGQTLDGCIWVTGSGQTCCNVAIEPFSQYTYKAVEISSPVTRAQIRMNVYDLSSKPAKVLRKDEVYNIDLDTGTTTDEMVTLNIATSSTASLLPAGWYFGNRHGSDLRTNVKINGLNEWNMNKLGWYKVQGEPGYENYDQIRKASVLEAFSATTENCGDNKLKTNFAASYYNRFPSEAEHVSSYLFSKVDHVVRNDSARQVIAFHRSSPRLDIRLTFRRDNKVVLIYDGSEMKDFTGTIFLDRFSNRYLNLTIIQGAGSITGSIRGQEKDSFYVYINSKEPKNHHEIVRISSPCRQVGEILSAEVCLKPLGTEEDIIDWLCHDVICTEKKNEDFILPEDEVDYEKKEQDDILSLGTWARYMNPAKWFDGKTGMVEGIIIAVFMVLLVIVITIIIKLLKMFHCCVKCITCIGRVRSRSRENYEKVRFRAGSFGRDRDRVKSVVPMVARSRSTGGGGEDSSIADDLHYIVVNDNTSNHYETLPKKVRFDSGQFFTSKKWAF